MASILPETNLNMANKLAAFSQEEKVTDIPKEYAWDFEKNDFKLKDGKFQIVEGIEALKIWIWKSLKTSKGKYPIYSGAYGNEFEKIIGKGFSKSLIESEAKRLTLECLKENQHILGVKNFEVDKNNDILTITFTAITECGEVTIDV
ncbi:MULTISPECIES: DUF2634 domain-containing protein [Clostridium]|uniref:DUF2634 domain-containing protein n=1 Tax=Clostridium TaxID=1485 RepID=UPI000CDAD4F1|nr:DUF2634 domain-containing protein [Clostridium sp. 2-1]MBN7573670.1 DUF2634 domain-containing protein [Clostridium beijerinckii]MBN7578916.1 DUF2634 domain-containing protein [Clostridium beijerinckii]MBN7583301.1 DUF2634 domain-containing protein [Clostridium beijerinckii]MBO0521221.1 DUF2634 domain-containing protein [Clostridium beijerinckii]MZK52627.1 DUF2634 domain-containing protein [Clostridium beijerinckii]